MSSEHPDRHSAEQLLRGVPAARLAAGPLGEHLCAAAAPARPAELAGRPQAIAAFRAARTAAPPARPAGVPTNSWGTKLLTLKVAALLAATATGSIAMVTASGTVPLLADPRPPSVSPDRSARPTASPPAQPDRPTSVRTAAPAATPAASSASLVQACRDHAPTIGSGPSRSGADFAALVAAAGGRDRVVPFCAQLLSQPKPTVDSTTAPCPGESRLPARMRPDAARSGANCPGSALPPSPAGHRPTPPNQGKRPSPSADQGGPGGGRSTPPGHPPPRR